MTDLASCTKFDLWQHYLKIDKLIYDMKLVIENLQIIIDDLVLISVLNYFDFYFTKFFGILNHKVREKE